MKIKDLPKSDRPREKLIAKGADNLKDSELLAILLRTGTKGKNVIEIASHILAKYSKKRLLQMTYEDLSKISGIDSGKATTLLAAFELSKRALVRTLIGMPTALRGTAHGVSRLRRSYAVSSDAPECVRHILAGAKLLIWYRFRRL